jgi:cell division protein FtsQ
VTAQRRAAGERAARQRQAQSRAPRARAVALPARRAPRAAGVASGHSLLGRFLPSRRSILVGLALIVLAAGAYVAARKTSTFAVAHLEIVGASPEVQKQVRREIAPLVGTSLLALDGSSLERRIEALPAVVSVGYDRAFPHTLRLTIVPETPVAVLRRGAETWLLSGRGRIVAHIPARTYPSLPRIWVPRATQVAAGAFVAPDGAGSAARALALALAARFPARIATAAMTHRELVLRLRSGLEVRLGEPTDVRLKLAVAWRALRGLPAGATYLDVSVPGRPVAGTQPSSLR